MLVSYFFGACASEGFCSYARELFGRGDRVLIIKGGPGCGKSTFMRAVAKEAKRRGQFSVRPIRILSTVSVSRRWGLPSPTALRRTFWNRSFAAALKIM